MFILAISPGRGFDGIRLKAILSSGIDALMIREKQLEAKPLLELVRQVQDLAPQVELWVNGRLDVAPEAVDMGQHPVQLHVARERAGRLDPPGALWRDVDGEIEERHQRGGPRRRGGRLRDGEEPHFDVGGHRRGRRVHEVVRDQHLLLRAESHRIAERELLRSGQRGPSLLRRARAAALSRPLHRLIR